MRRQLITVSVGIENLIGRTFKFVGINRLAYIPIFVPQSSEMIDVHQNATIHSIFN